MDGTSLDAKATSASLSPSARVSHLKFTYYYFGGVGRFLNVCPRFSVLVSRLEKRRLKFKDLKSPLPYRLLLSLPPHRVLL